MKKMTDKDNWPLASDFLESTVNLDDESFITEVYRTYLLREADENGRKNHLRFLTQGQLTREQMLDGFQNSPEFNLVWQSKAEIDRRQKTLLIRQNLGSVEPPIPGNKEFLESTAELPDRLFVTATYRTFLLREPDAGGLKGYIQVLSKGQLTREQMLDGFQNSPEFELVWQSTVEVNTLVSNKFNKLIYKFYNKINYFVEIVYYKLGLHFYSKKKLDLAINFFIASIQVNPNYELPYLYLYHILRANQLINYFTFLIGFYSKIIDTNYHCSFAYTNLADILTHKGNINAAVKYYSIACEKEVHNSSKIQQKIRVNLERKPDFIVIGMAKCGTTFLFNIVKSHPLVFGLRKEVYYFNNESIFKHPQGKKWYYSQFSYVPQNMKAGEATPEYIYYNKHISSRVFNTFPDVKIICVFRNPIIRIISYYYMLYNFGLESKKLESIIISDLKYFESANISSESFWNLPRNSIWYSLYYYMIEPWINLFPKKQILILKSEEMFQLPQTTVSKVFNFLELPDHSIEDIKEKESLKNSGNYKFRLDESVKLALQDFFQSFNNMLENLVDRKFNWW